MLITLIEVTALLLGVLLGAWLFNRAVPTEPGSVLGQESPKSQNHEFFANRRKPSFGW